MRDPNKPLTTLQSLNDDSLEHIAFHLGTIDFRGPPKYLRDLLGTCRSINLVLSLPTNQNLYARIFKDKFDTSAVQRRFRTMQHTPTPGSTPRFGSTALTWELQNRFRVLQRISCAAHLGELLADDDTDDLWTVYLMCIESDGKNIEQLIHAQLPKYLDIYLAQNLLPAHAKRGYPKDTVERALALWLMWFFTSKESIMTLPETHEDIMRSLLKQYLFASFKYNDCLAPWTQFILPTSSPEENLRSNGPRAAATTLLHAAVPHQGHAPFHQQGPLMPMVTTISGPYAPPQLVFREHAEVVNTYGSLMRIVPPNASHAAMLLYASWLSKRPLVAPELGFHPYTREQLKRGEHIKLRLPHLKDSRVYDGDFARLISCINASVSPANPSFFHPGIMHGTWSGVFVYGDFGHIQEMLNGDESAISNALIGQIPQSWQISEHHFVRDRRRRPNHPSTAQRHAMEIDTSDASGSDSDSPKDFPTYEDEDEDPLPTGSALDGYLPRGVELKTVAFPFPGLDASYLAQDPNDPRGFSKVTTRYRTWDGPGWRDSELPEDGLSVAEGGGVEGDLLDPFTIYGKHPVTQVWDDDSPIFWDRPPPLGSTERREWEDDREQNPERVVDIILTGGPFVDDDRMPDVSYKLQGRVRPWDGLITITKTWTGTVTGSHIFRGYIHEGGNFVGRFRDSMANETSHGYEGFFFMNRRALT